MLSESLMYVYWSKKDNTSILISDTSPLMMSSGKIPTVKMLATFLSISSFYCQMSLIYFTVWVFVKHRPNPGKGGVTKMTKQSPIALWSCICYTLIRLRTFECFSLFFGPATRWWFFGWWCEPVVLCKAMHYRQHGITRVAAQQSSCLHRTPTLYVGRACLNACLCSKGQRLNDVPMEIAECIVLNGP